VITEILDGMSTVRANTKTGHCMTAWAQGLAMFNAAITQATIGVYLPEHERGAVLRKYFSLQRTGYLLGPLAG